MYRTRPSAPDRTSSRSFQTAELYSKVCPTIRRTRRLRGRVHQHPRRPPPTWSAASRRGRACPLRWRAARGRRAIAVRRCGDDDGIDVAEDVVQVGRQPGRRIAGRRLAQSFLVAVDDADGDTGHAAQHPDVFRAPVAEPDDARSALLFPEPPSLNPSGLDVPLGAGHLLRPSPAPPHPCCSAASPPNGSRAECGLVVARPSTRSARWTYRGPGLGITERHRSYAAGGRWR